MCSECGMIQNPNDLNTHWRRRHGDIYKEYRESGKLNMEEEKLPRNPHCEWMDRLILKLDKYSRGRIKEDPYWEFLYQTVKKEFCLIFWQNRKIWKLTLPEPTCRYV